MTASAVTVDEVTLLPGATPFSRDEHLLRRRRRRYQHHPLPLRRPLDQPVRVVAEPSWLLADVAVYVAIFTRIGITPLTVTNELKMNFLRPAIGHDVLACARLLEIGRRIAYATVELTESHQPDRLVAHATASYVLPDAEPTTRRRPDGRHRGPGEEHELHHGPTATARSRSCPSPSGATRQVHRDLGRRPHRRAAGHVRGPAAREVRRPRAAGRREGRRRRGAGSTTARSSPTSGSTPSSAGRSSEYSFEPDPLRRDAHGRVGHRRPHRRHGPQRRLRVAELPVVPARASPASASS